MTMLWRLWGTCPDSCISPGDEYKIFYMSLHKYNQNGYKFLYPRPILVGIYMYNIFCLMINICTVYINTYNINVSYVLINFFYLIMCFHLIFFMCYYLLTWHHFETEVNTWHAVNPCASLELILSHKLCESH